KNDQDSCVTYVPETTSIHVGDRINFNTNSSTPITVNIPAGLFSAHDTSIVVSRGTNTTPPSAQRLGTYPLSSSPRACATVTGRGGEHRDGTRNRNLAGAGREPDRRVSTPRSGRGRRDGRERTRCLSRWSASDQP